MNYKGIIFFLGLNCLLISLFSILNIAYSVHLNFNIDLKSYIFSLAISSIAGVLFCWFGYKKSKDININEQIILILSTFIFIPLLISIPYNLSIYNISFLDSYFESMSGFTTTGFSIIENIETIDEPLLLWRSSSQWIGGLFFLLATVGTLGSKKMKIKPAYLIQDTNTGGNFYKNFNYNFIKIFIIYFVSTIFIIFLLNLTNIRLLDSFNLAFTAISSGGFINKNNLLDIVDNNLQIFTLSAVLLFPILNFYLFFKIFTNNFKIKEHQEDLHLVLLLITLVLFFYFLIIPEEGVVNILLSVTTSLATSGISTYSGNFDVSLFFIILTIIGGSLLSTSSGFKYVRFYILLKISYQEIYKLVKPINIFNRNLFNSEIIVDDDDAKKSFLVFISFIAAIFVLTAILTLDNISFESSFKLSILTLTNTTVSSLYGLNNISFFEMNSFTKIFLIIFMIFGKIETIAILFLIKKFIFRE